MSLSLQTVNVLICDRGAGQALQFKCNGFNLDG